MKKKRFGKKKSRANAAQARQRLRKKVQESLPEVLAGEIGEDWGNDLAPPARTRSPRARPAVEADGEGDGAITDQELATGVVVAISSGNCRVDAGGELLSCTLPSRLARTQQEGLAVGDRVRYDERDDGSHWLVEVLPRATALSRPDPRNPRHQRVIAANVDVVVHVVSLRRPPLRPALVDRFLIAIEKSGAEPLVCVNKIDLVPPAEREEALAPLAPHRALGTPILLTSAETGEGIDDLAARLAGRTAALVGHSGVGKSSLLNALAGGERARTGAVDRKHHRGRHTTSAASLRRLPGEIYVIDTPGIRELGLWRLDPGWLGRSFPDLVELAPSCRFNDCSHLHEPACAVRAAVEDGRLEPARYQSYARIRDSLEADEAP